MGLITSEKGGEFNKFKKVSSEDAKSILGYMDSKSKQKVKEYIKEANKEGKSIHQISQEIRENMGKEASNKFIHAAKKHAGGGLTEREKRRNIARRRDETSQEATDYIRSTVTFAGGDVESSHRVSIQDNSQNSGGSGFINQGDKRGVSVNDSSRKGGRNGFVNNQGASFAGDLGNNNSGGGKKRGGKKPLGL